MRTISLSALRRDARPNPTIFLLLLVLSGVSGCQVYRGIGKGQRVDPDRPRPHHEVSKGGQEILLEVTTTPDGGVAGIRFEKSSGREAVDNYVAESIRTGWPRVASTRSIVRIRHLKGGGFSEPEIVSSAPLP